mmetsp:Transcript_108035/g.304359  ORF Transcript_108035/g.304359 Transcript_108035/m.304359 type:complete len:212 (-) Transcript_108035:827-1462(-)
MDVDGIGTVHVKLFESRPDGGFLVVQFFVHGRSQKLSVVDHARTVGVRLGQELLEILWDREVRSFESHTELGDGHSAVGVRVHAEEHFFQAVELARGELRSDHRQRGLFQPMHAGEGFEVANLQHGWCLVLSDGLARLLNPVDLQRLARGRPLRRGHRQQLLQEGLCDLGHLRPSTPLHCHLARLHPLHDPLHVLPRERHLAREHDVSDDT